MSHIAPTLHLLYRLMLDGGHVLSCNQNGDGETYVVEIEPNPTFDCNEVRTRYGKGYGPFQIILVPNIVDYYRKFYDKL